MYNNHVPLSILCSFSCDCIARIILPAFQSLATIRISFSMSIFLFIYFRIYYLSFSLSFPFHSLSHSATHSLCEGFAVFVTWLRLVFFIVLSLLLVFPSSLSLMALCLHFVTGYRLDFVDLLLCVLDTSVFTFAALRYWLISGWICSLFLFCFVLILCSLHNLAILFCLTILFWRCVRCCLTFVLLLLELLFSYLPGLGFPSLLPLFRDSYCPDFF